MTKVVICPQFLGTLYFNTLLPMPALPLRTVTKERGIVEIYKAKHVRGVLPWVEKQAEAMFY